MPQQELLYILFVCRNELMKRRIEEADGNRMSLREPHKAPQSRPAASGRIFSRAASLSSTVSEQIISLKASILSPLEEHMLCTAKTDTLCAQLSCLLSVSRSICVCSDLELSVLVSPAHDSAECRRLIEASTVGMIPSYILPVEPSIEI